jgi:2-C-methyl-D-erythritol 4-phosphate cytidylyltransferase
VEWDRVDVGMVLGDRFCVKVAHPEDLAIAEALYPLFKNSEMKYSDGNG